MSAQAAPGKALINENILESRQYKVIAKYQSRIIDKARKLCGAAESFIISPSVSYEPFVPEQPEGSSLPEQPEKPSPDIADTLTPSCGVYFSDRGRKEFKPLAIVKGYNPKMIQIKRVINNEETEQLADSAFTAKSMRRGQYLMMLEELNFLLRETNEKGGSWYAERGMVPPPNGSNNEPETLHLFVQKTVAFDGTALGREIVSVTTSINVLNVSAEKRHWEAIEQKHILPAQYTGIVLDEGLVVQRWRESEASRNKFV